MTFFCQEEGAHTCSCLLNVVLYIQFPAKNAFPLNFSLCLSRACLGKIIIFIEFVLAKWLPQRRFFAPVKLMLHDASLPLLSGQVNCPGGPVVLALQNLGLHPIRKRISVLSAFPMFVPSLSWQNDAFLV
jgi:hypothetical protein